MFMEMFIRRICFILSFFHSNFDLWVLCVAFFVSGDSDCIWIRIYGVIGDSILFDFRWDFLFVNSLGIENWFLMYWNEQNLLGRRLKISLSRIIGLFLLLVLVATATHLGPITEPTFSLDRNGLLHKNFTTSVSATIPLLALKQFSTVSVWLLAWEWSQILAPSVHWLGHLGILSS